LAEKFGRAKFGDAEDSAELLEALEDSPLESQGKGFSGARSLRSQQISRTSGTNFNVLEERRRINFRGWKTCAFKWCAKRFVR
jgi:hypothetical protein